MSPSVVPVNERGEARTSYHGTLQDVYQPRPQLAQQNTSLLQRYSDDQVHDVVCVGFGPASLAIATALHDALEDGTPRLQTDKPKIRFIEKQAHFAWHAGMLLPGAKMQISFIKDMATFRNPRSQFTFLNYLHEKNRLVQFTNLGTFLPQRVEYEDYMRWCAGWFDSVVDYGHSVQSIDVGKLDDATGAVDYFNVTSLDQITGNTTTLRAKHVIIATGGRPNMPKSLPLHHPRIIHSSQYITKIDSILPNGQAPRSVAVIGAGQSAAEIFNNIPSRFPGAQAHLLIRGAALRPSDDSPFVNEVFNPDRVDDIYAQDPILRQAQITRDKATNYSVVRLELLEHIYSVLYGYRIQNEDETTWPQRIHPHRQILGAEDTILDGRPALKLHIQNNSGEFRAHRPTSTAESLTVDLVIVACGYKRDAHEDLLQNVRHLRPASVANADNNKWTVRRDYGVVFEYGAVQPDAGIWLQGCNEATHGLSDSLLSILANRGGEIVESIFARDDHFAVKARAALNGF